MAQRLSVLLLAALLGGAPASAQSTTDPVAPSSSSSEGEGDTPERADSDENDREPATGSASSPSGSTTTEQPTTTSSPSTHRSGAAPARSTTRRSSARSSAGSSRSTRTSRSGRRDDERPTEEEEDAEDWGVFYLQLLGGYSYANVISFSQNNFLPETERVEGSGFFGGAGLGFRLEILTLGGQATLASYAPTADDGFELGTVIGTIGLHLPVPGIQPYFRIGAGYAWMGKANYADPGISETRVYGFVVEGGFGVDIKLARPISLGLGVDAAYLNLGRQSASELGMIDDVNFEEDGDAVGYQIRGHVHLTFHI